MIESNYYNDNPDLQTQVSAILDWSEIVEAYELGFADHAEYKKSGDERLAFAPSTVDEAVQNYKMIFESVGDVFGGYVSQRSAEMDHQGLKYANGKVTFPPAMLECFDKTVEAGLHPYSMNRKYGGLGLPAVAQCIQMEIMSRADAAFSIALGCVNLAETIERFGSESMVETWVPKMAQGAVCGAMALTEPNYGSDLSNIQTKAVKGEDGVWRLTGAKRFITHGCGLGDRPSVILTLARTGTPTSGAKGLSFFLVKSSDVFIAGIEKKMGLHCSPTCEVVYDNSPGELIGRESFGLIRYAMGMMNAARLSIAAQAMGIATAAYYEGRKYASERAQFGKQIEAIPAVKKMLNRMEREVIAMRCLLYEAARTVDMYTWRLHHMEHSGAADKDIKNNETIRKWNKLADFFTPLAKYYTSEMCNSVAFDALQIHGGSGYTEDYDVSRIYRDARITNIYEGTTQLQMHACIGGITAGMSATGFLRAYIDEETAKFKSSPQLLQLRDMFEQVANAYRDIKDAELKDTYAFEAVESGARYLNTMLLERSASRLEPGAREERLKLSRAYFVDSLAIMQANLIKMQEGAALREPALAGV